MKEHPILFSTPMVQAILEGRKSQTRRMVKYPSIYNINEFIGWRIKPHKDSPALYSFWYDTNYTLPAFRCPYGQPQDHLYVKEPWTQNGLNYFRYKADWPEGKGLFTNPSVPDKFRNKWKPSIYMPREAARIFLRVTDIRVERLQDITEEDAIAEGIDVFNNPCAAFGSHGKHYDYSQKHRTHTVADKLLNTAKESYKTLWESINGKGSWEKNPWVWVIKFERIEKQENETK